MANDFLEFPAHYGKVSNSFCVRAVCAFVVQIVVFTVCTHHSQDGDALADFHTEYSTGSLIALHFVDQRMFGEFPFQCFATNAIDRFANGINNFFLFQYTQNFFLGDEVA